MKTALITVMGLTALSQTTFADYVYRFEALSGEYAGSTVHGRIRLPESLAGSTEWKLDDATSFWFKSSYKSGYRWKTEDLAHSFDVSFDQPVGSDLLTPNALGGASGYSPDWRMDTEDDIALGIGADRSRPLWNLYEIGRDGNFDWRSTPGPQGQAQWNLVLVPTPSSLALLGVGGALILKRRR